MEIQFTDYCKITDIKQYLTDRIRLQICVILNKKNKDGSGYRSFHSEYHYPPEFKGEERYSITRNYTEFMTLHDTVDYRNDINIYPGDIFVFRKFFHSIAEKWYEGPTSIYGIEDNQLVIKGKFTPVKIPMFNGQLFYMTPIVYTYSDGTREKGARIFMNDQSVFADLNLYNFYALCYYIENVDIIQYAAEMVNYVKTQPYGKNIMSSNYN